MDGAAISSGLAVFERELIRARTSDDCEVSLTSSVSPLSSTDRELIQQLLEDENTLDRHLRPVRPRPSDVRATFAPILRRWIAEGKFFNAQKLVSPHHVLFEIATNSQSVRLAKAGIYEHWMALLMIDTLGISIACYAPKYLGPDGKLKTDIDKGVITKPIPQRAKIFFDQKILFWKGQFYTRADVIKMQANKLGGVHLDFRRKDDETHINEIKNYFGFEIKPNTHQMHQMLIGDEISIARADSTRRREYTMPRNSLL